MEKICQNCKFYDPPDSKYGKKKDMGRCISNKMVYVNNNSFPMGDKLGVWTDSEDQDSDYGVAKSPYFFVGSNFGCIHFQPKS